MDSTHLIHQRSHLQLVHWWVAGVRAAKTLLGGILFLRFMQKRVALLF
jgi:hypothetical protein